MVKGLGLETSPGRHGSLSVQRAVFLACTTARPPSERHDYVHDSRESRRAE